MTEHALPLDMLSPQYSLSELPLSPCQQWPELLPQLKASIDFFATTMSAQPFLVCQAASFFDLPTIFTQLAVKPVASASAFALIFSPSSPSKAICLSLTESQYLSIQHALEALRQSTTEQTLQQALADLANQLEGSEASELHKALGALNLHLQGQPQSVSPEAYIKIWRSSPGVTYCHQFNRQQLFGEQLMPASGQIAGLEQLNLGLVAKAANGILAINAEDILAEANLWFELKSCLRTATFSWDKLASHQRLWQAQDLAISTKLIVTGHASAIADLYQLDPELASQCLIETELPLDLEATEANVTAYLSQINWQLKNDGLAPLTQALYYPVLKRAAFLCEHQQLLSLNIADVMKPLRLMQHLGLNQDALGFDQALESLAQHINGQQLFSDLSYKDRQTQIELSGSRVGQINGLSVIDFNGLGHSFGEPIRITANVFQGDGDFMDVERKAELAGNIHAKSMMIIHGFLSELFALEHHFPYSANIVFEQSYHEIEGDSASLASCLALLSALARLPIEQNTAVTGALDQKGNVLAVGGINEKIEGFYRVSQLLNITTPLAVVIPKANLKQLNLSQALLLACERQSLSIYAVDNIEQAIPHLFKLEAGRLSDETTVFGKVYKRVNIGSDEPSLAQALIHKFTKLFKLS
ncbi:S16 family serine protease [Agarivorans sp.]|uniref:S16 family serine protease n=1 Tax=Agarivorans sp. TaxID=1872412 RepID=UPI003D000B69